MSLLVTDSTDCEREQDKRTIDLSVNEFISNGRHTVNAISPPQTPSQARHKHNTRKRGEPSKESGPSSTILAHRVSAQGTRSPVDLQQGANRRRIY